MSPILATFLIDVHAPDQVKIERGDTVRMMAPDPNMWKRFLHWCTFRPRPMKSQVFVVTHMSHSTGRVTCVEKEGEA